MKFGKRLAAEAARQWTEQYLDYKAIKKALKHDIRHGDPTAQMFVKVLLVELQKVSTFYVDKAAELEAGLQEVTSADDAALSQALQQIQALIKFVALNYLAVVKAVKKRNRHFKDAFEEAAVPAMHPLDFLRQEVFFTSPRLAALATQAEVLRREEQAAAQQAPPEQLLEEYQCPICLDVLRSPVVLTCAHRFCWGCLVAHFAAVRGPHPRPHQHKTCQAPHAGVCTEGCCAPKPRAEEGPAGRNEEALVVLEKIVEASDCEDSGCYNCPLCRKPQVLNIESLTVDPHLTKFVEELRLQLRPADPAAAAAGAAAAVSRCSSAASMISSLSSSSSTAADVDVLVADAAGWLLPPQLPQHAGRLTVLLDLDGTLVSSFTPRRAPKLPASMQTHLVGQGSSLNPCGVFVVERPGLQQFLEQLAGFAEVVVFTAGLEEYASPIIDAIDPDNAYITARIYREGTTRTDYYQCVKDMSMVGRDLSRTVLVDDTPLAFLHQPDNGVPVLGFRGDPDDRLLNEAVLPLLQTLSGAPDVRLLLERRFDMFNWFRRHGYPDSIWEKGIHAAAAGAKGSLQACQNTAGAAAAAVEAEAIKQSANAPAVVQIKARAGPSRGTLLLFDFDRTLTDYDAGERLVGELAPELVPMLAALQMPANFVPITNDVLKEMMRRGISRAQLLATLQLMGGEVPTSVSQLLRWAQQRGLDVKVLSDCNSVFIESILAGAQLSGCVQEIITNQAGFATSCCSAQEDAPGLGAAASTSSSSSSSMSEGGSPASSSDDEERLYLSISPRVDYTKSKHGCGLCPENLCKGRELAAIQQQQLYDRIVYAGDGANDICPALQLRKGDVLLARQGHALSEYVAAAGGDASLRQVEAQVHLWDTHAQLADLVRRYA